MKARNIMLIAAAALTLAACNTEYDNYDAPETVFAGRLIDPDGDPFYFDSSKNMFRFFQTGYGKTDGGTSMRIANDGTFQQLLYNGETYKLTLSSSIDYPFTIDEFPARASGQGYDSIQYKITGPVDVTYTVRPYYKITSMTPEFDGKNINVTFTVKKLKSDAPKIKRAYIYLGTTVNVNTNNKCQKFTTIKDAGTDEQTFTAKIPVSYYRSKTYGMVNNYRTSAFYRVALMLTGYNDYYLMSQVETVDGLTDLEQ